METVKRRVEAVANSGEMPTTQDIGRDTARIPDCSAEREDRARKPLEGLRATWGSPGGADLFRLSPTLSRRCILLTLSSDAEHRG